MDIWWSVVIPAAAAVLGACVGAIITGLIQVQATAMTAFIPARLEAYRALEAAMRNAAQGVSPAVAVNLYEAINSATLVASKNTLALLAELNEMVRAAEKMNPIDTDKFFALRQRLQSAMREDLFSYPVPRPRSKGM